MLPRLLLASVAGLSLALAFEPVAVAYLMVPALAGFALTTRGLTSRRAAASGLAFGAGFYFVHIYWMSPSIGVPAWLILAAVEALFYGALGAVSTWVQRLPAWPIWLSAGWVTMEMVRSQWPWSGMPFGRLAFGVMDTPITNLLAYGGLNGVGFVVALIGFAVAAVLVQRGASRRLAGGAALVALTSASVLPAVVPYSLTSTGEANVAVVQGDVPGRGNDVLVDVAQLTDNHVQATLELADAVALGEVERPDFVLWPENSTAVDPFRDLGVNAAIRSASSAIGVPILVGAIVDAGPERVLSQGIVWDPVSGQGERYTKQHPVAFGEYIPLRDLLPESLTSSGQLARIPRDMISGSNTEPLDVGGVEVADSICFDIAFSDAIYDQVAAGAEMLTVQTSNASYIFSDQIDQQFAITRARAVEAGRYLAVASTNGISGVIAPDGTVVAESEVRVRDVLVEEVTLKEGITPGLQVDRALDWVAPVVAVLSLLFGVIAYRRGRESDLGEGSPEPVAAASDTGADRE